MVNTHIDSPYKYQPPPQGGFFLYILAPQFSLPAHPPPREYGVSLIRNGSGGKQATPGLGRRPKLTRRLMPCPQTTQTAAEGAPCQSSGPMYPFGWLSTYFVQSAHTGWAGSLLSAGC